MIDAQEVRRKKLATIDVISWEETFPEGNTKCYAALQLWLDGELEDSLIFGPHDSEDGAWNEATTTFWDADPGDLLHIFEEEMR